MKDRFDSISITGFILSLVSILFFPFCLFGLGFSIWGFVRTNKKPKTSGNNLAIAGIIISSIMLITSLFIIGIIFALFGLISYNLEISSNNSITQENTEIANPASTYCIENGNNLEIRTDSNGGQEGICISEDKKECEEWAYYRGECEL